MLPEVDVELSPHDVVRPDLAGWRRDRLPAPWDARPIRVVPDWVCEVLSPSTASRDRVEKRRLYARSGVAFYWLIDPAAGTLEALRLDDGGRWLEPGSWSTADGARIAPFDGIELELARIFAPEDPATSGGGSGTLGT